MDTTTDRGYRWMLRGQPPLFSFPRSAYAAGIGYAYYLHRLQMPAMCGSIGYVDEDSPTYPIPFLRRKPAYAIMPGGYACLLRYFAQPFQVMPRFMQFGDLKSSRPSCQVCQWPCYPLVGSYVL